MFARDRSITTTRRPGDRGRDSTSCNEPKKERKRGARVLDKNSEEIQETGRSIAPATIDRQIAPLPLNSTLIWTLRASLPGRLGGLVSPPPHLAGEFIYFVAHIRGKGSCRPRVIQMQTTSVEKERVRAWPGDLLAPWIGDRTRETREAYRVTELPRLSNHRFDGDLPRITRSMKHRGIRAPLLVSIWIVQCWALIEIEVFFSADNR